MTYDQFAKASINHVREIMARLAGNEDLDGHNYLCRFNLLAISRKPQEKVFVLGAKGRRLLQEMGYPASWYFRPNKLKFLSYGYVLHNLILTRTMIAAQTWAKDNPTFFLTEKRIAYELSGKVIPDGWLMFEEYTKEGVYEHPVIIEIDRGMENKDKFRAHVRGRLNYLQSGEYRREFSTDVATIAYVTTGQTETYKTTPQKGDVCVIELLREMRMLEWARVFRVADVEFGTIYNNSLFEENVWYRPDSSHPLPLFD